MPPSVPATPAAAVLARRGGAWRFVVRDQRVTCRPWRGFDEAAAQMFDMPRRFGLKEHERAANDYARKAFGTTAPLPVRAVEIEVWRQRWRATQAAAAEAAAADGGVSVARAAVVGGGAAIASPAIATSPAVAAGAARPQPSPTPPPPAAATPSAAAPPPPSQKPPPGLLPQGTVLYGNDIEGTAFPEGAEGAEDGGGAGAGEWSLGVSDAAGHASVGCVSDACAGGLMRSQEQASHTPSLTPPHPPPPRHPPRPCRGHPRPPCGSWTAASCQE